MRSPVRLPVVSRTSSPAGSREFASGHELLDSLASDLETSGDEPSVDATGSDRLKRPDER